MVGAECFVFLISETLVNLSEGRPAWQSSQWYPMTHLAVDGIDNPKWSAGSCTHTTESGITERPVWSVDLGNFADVYYVEVISRDILEYKAFSILKTSSSYDTNLTFLFEFFVY